MKKKSFSTPIILIGLGILSICLIVLFTSVAIAFTPQTVAGEYEEVDFYGTYQIDDQDESYIQSIDDFKIDTCDQVVFNGHLSIDIPDDKWLIVNVCNAWLEVEADSKLIASNYHEYGARTNTPGYSFLYISGEDLDKDSVITFTFKNPYKVFQNIKPITFCMSNLCCGEKDVAYDIMLEKDTVSIIISVSICFLGLFAFTLAGLLSKRVLYRNIALAFWAITGGIYVLTDGIYNFLPLWFDNPVLCLVIDEFSSYMLPIATFLFIRQYVETKVAKHYMSILAIGGIILAIVGYCFQIFGFMDVLLSQYYLMLFIDLGIIGTVVTLIYETFILKCKSTNKLFVSLLPIIISSIFDALNAVFAFAPDRYSMRIGLLLSIAAQVCFLIMETVQYNKELARVSEMQKELLQMRVSIMVSQIQPHFLYNSLTSIAQLCEKDPKQAKKSTIEFADYMRRNMNSLKDQSPVSFESELNHLKTYLSLEKMRFGEDLNIELDIQATNFSIPSLSVQPLVENAVKHGVGMKEDGGTVTICTREYDDHYEIVVSDDGVGFDTTKAPDDNRIHVGMENVRNRLKTMCNATLEITSQINVGTTATIIVPKED